MEYISIIKDDVDLSKSHRYLRIPHPRTGQAQLYLPYRCTKGEESILEVSKISGSQRRTWFIGDNGIDAGNILMHYPIDPLFLVIPLVQAVSSKAQFQPLSDIFADLPTHPAFSLTPPFTPASSGPGSSSSSAVLGKGKNADSGAGSGSGQGGYNADLAELLKLKIVRRVFRACCEVKEIPIMPDESSSNAEVEQRPRRPQAQTQRYYKPSIQLAIKHLQRKVDHFAQVSEFEKFDHLVRSLGRDGLLGQGASGDELRRLARIRAACDHMQQWLDPEVTKRLIGTYDFTPLTKHLSDMSAAAIAASQMPSNNKSDKDKDAKSLKRKGSGSVSSRGVEALKKVNTNNMAKLTSFFKPKSGDDKAKTPASKQKK
ncbi:hypothetical protein IAU59_007430 [Kwoniella sp. CBS 9459]